jgi:hypothetical protein
MNSLIHFQLPKVPTILVHPFLVPHTTGLHVPLIPVELDIRLRGRIVPLTGIASEEGVDILQVSLVQVVRLPFGRLDMMLSGC